MADPLLTEIGWAGTALRLAGTLEPGGAVREIELLLRERDGDGLLRVPASAREGDGRVAFEAEVDVATLAGGNPLPGGLWDVSLSVGAPMETSVVPLGPGRAPGLDASPLRRFLPDSCTVIAYFGAGGALAIDVGGRSHVAGSVAADTLSWNEEREEIVVAGHLDVRRSGRPVSGTLIMTERRSRHVYASRCWRSARTGSATGRWCPRRGRSSTTRCRAGPGTSRCASASPGCTARCGCWRRTSRWTSGCGGACGTSGSSPPRRPAR
ncbi:hypothetical protein ACFFWA_18695 [Actinomadura verrucosospora]|uniref:hypothetical protein n=1 Tax=Actinomadura verrucosospora TaxID=46165 RepID=UPI0031EEEF27